MADRQGASRRFGTVRKLASGRYQVRYYDRAGRRHSAPRTFPTKTDARRYLANIEADLTRGEWNNPRLGQTPFRVWVERWEGSTSNLRPKTRDLYAYLIERFLKPRFGDVPLAAIDTLAVRTWLADEERAGKAAPSTRAKAYRLLSRILGLAVEAGYIPRNPCTVKGAGVERSPEMRVATVKQVMALADAVPPGFRALVLTAAGGGLRWGELAGLRRRRVDPTGRRVSVAEQAVEIRGQVTFTEPKTEAAKWTVVLPRFAADALATHLTTWAESGPDGLVFPALGGGPLRHSSFHGRIWQPATRSVGVKGLRFHDLRHTAATLALIAGATTRELMSRLGRTSPAAALRYQHALAERDADVADALDQLFQDDGKRRARKR